MIRVFMSYGMNGKTEEEQRKSRRELRKKVEKYFSGNGQDRIEKYREIWKRKHPDYPVQGRVCYDLRHMNPMKFVRCVDNHKAEGTEKDGRLHYLGLAIQALDKVDAIIFAEDWRDHKGCVIEHQVAEMYGIKILEL